ncbi:hypothetical protein B566_EDAN012620 [Ephemera danica]|nr:hypothetical protein B566_EDAN012620 [Ephemera danica]
MFSRKFSSSSSNEEANEKRIKQIDTLKIFNDNVTEVIAGEEYRVDFPLIVNGSSQHTSLHITLPPEFPLEQPVLKVKPPVQHTWLESSTGNVVAAPGLLNFTVHSDLGRVVQAVISELRRNYTDGKSQHQTDGVMEGPLEIPAGGGMVDLLQRMHTEKLQQLCESDDVCDELLEQLPPMLTLEAEINKLDALNNEISNDILSHEEQLMQLQEQVKSKTKQVAELHTKYEERSCAYKQLSDLFTPLSIKTSLREAAVSSDHQSEYVAEEFLHGNLDVEHFIESFIAERMEVQHI